MAILDDVAKLCIQNRIRELEYKLDGYSKQIADAEELLREYKAMLAEHGARHVE